MADLHRQRLKKNKLITLKYSWEEANERRSQDLCIFCEEQETSLHHLKHKNLVLVIVGGDDDNDPISGDGVLDEKEISNRDSSTQDTPLSNGVLDENQVSEVESSIQELVSDGNNTTPNEESIQEEEVFPIQETVMVECDSIVEQVEDASDLFAGEERILEARSSILVTEETKAVLNESMILKEPLLLDNSWEVMKSGQTTEIHDLVQDDESYMVIESNVKTYCSLQSQVLSSILEPSHKIYNNPREILKELSCFDVRKDEFRSSYDCDIGKTDANQMFDQMSSVKTSREKYMRPLKSWKFKFKDSIEKGYKWRLLSSDLALVYELTIPMEDSFGKEMSQPNIRKLLRRVQFWAGIGLRESHTNAIVLFFHILAMGHTTIHKFNEDIGKSTYEAESSNEACFLTVVSEFGFEFFKRTQSSVYVHEMLSSSEQISERKYKVLKLMDFKRGCKGCSQDSIVALKDKILNLITKTVQMVKLEKDPHDAIAMIIEGKTTLATCDGAIDVAIIQEADIGVDISGVGGIQVVVGGSELNVDDRVWDPGGFQLQEIFIEKLKCNKVSVAYQVHEVSLQTLRSRFLKWGRFDTEKLRMRLSDTCRTVIKRRKEVKDY